MADLQLNMLIEKMGTALPLLPTQGLSESIKHKTHACIQRRVACLIQTSKVNSPYIQHTYLLNSKTYYSVLHLFLCPNILIQHSNTSVSQLTLTSLSHG